LGNISRSRLFWREKYLHKYNLYLFGVKKNTFIFFTGKIKYFFIFSQKNIYLFILVFFKKRKLINFKLSCHSDVVRFKFLGIPVGSNPRRRAAWKPILEALTKRLTLWSSRQLSFGGRIILINSVLASLPLYYFSFFKAPCCVLKNIDNSA
jgi:hypothetical protein